MLHYLKGTYKRCNSMSFFTAGLNIVLYNYQQGSYIWKLGFTVDFFQAQEKTPSLGMDNQQQGRVYTLYSIYSNFVSMLICISASYFPADSIVIKQRRLCIVLLA